ncbi:hypothetical protein B0T22DRAFT_495427 [Podospora appendiculata]|uniref:Spp2/MOS2 G-patch domain-containing protein n=1 Tax=Podospora appendiculata TaxID=314037 RepID=A0AAE0XF64_9PEZI|nr:hypothetical protein B0T22DRAFT_495427 [Podospora appendiculata]
MASSSVATANSSRSFRFRDSTIELGMLGAPASSSRGTKKPSRPAHGRRHRAHALHDESNSDSEGDEQANGAGRVEAITDYGEDEPREKHRHHAEHHDKRRRSPDRNSNHDGAAQQPSSKPGGDREGDAEPSSDAQDKPVKWGLTINMKTGGASKDKKQTKKPPLSHLSEPDDDGDGKRTIDDDALDALMGTKPAAKRKHDADANAADREPRLEDYRSVPIDDFGATLLKNFGWDGKLRGKVKEATKRANLVGLGATNVKGAEDLGSWDQKPTKDSRPARLEDYRREESKKRQRVDDRHGDSYKRERERERERDRGGRDR